MKFYGIPSEDRALEIVEFIKDGEWILEEEGKKSSLSCEEVKDKLKEIIQTVKRWKTQTKHLSSGAVLIFVHEPSNPKVFKIYDLASLGCATSLSPPRWKIYRKEMEGQLFP